MGPDVPPGEEAYLLEQQWMNSCRLSHDLFCLCGDFRQHFLPGCGVFTAAEDGAGGRVDDMDDIMVNFDLGVVEDAAGPDVAG